MIPWQVRGALGKGVFSTVLSCTDRLAVEAAEAGGAEAAGPSVVAIKLIRNNDVMRKAALKELEILNEVTKADPENKRCALPFTHLSPLSSRRPLSP